MVAQTRDTTRVHDLGVRCGGSRWWPKTGDGRGDIKRDVQNRSPKQGREIEARSRCKRQSAKIRTQNESPKHERETEA